jgi:signal peptidase II
VQERRAVTALTDDPPAGAGQVGAHPGPVRLAVAGGVVAAVLLVDQLTKSWAVARLQRGPIHVLGRLDLELARNTGGSFSILQGQSGLLVVVAVVLVAVLAVMVWRSRTVGRAALIGLVLGGALGNLADRLFRGDHGAVVDFVAVHVWPTFNVADACIVVGCGLLLVSLLRGARER